MKFIFKRNGGIAPFWRKYVANKFVVEIITIIYEL